MPAFGRTRRTAVASTCAAEWRSTMSASADFAVRIESVASDSIGRESSTVRPFTTAATAARASPAPIDSATSRGVVPRATSRVLPSGSVIRIFCWSVIRCFGNAFVRERRQGGESCRRLQRRSARKRSRGGLVEEARPCGPAHVARIVTRGVSVSALGQIDPVDATVAVPVHQSRQRHAARRDPQLAPAARRHPAAHVAVARPELAAPRVQPAEDDRTEHVAEVAPVEDAAPIRAPEDHVLPRATLPAHRDGRAPAPAPRAAPFPAENRMPLTRAAERRTVAALAAPLTIGAIATTLGRTAVIPVVAVALPAAAVPLALADAIVVIALVAVIVPIAIRTSLRLDRRRHRQRQQHGRGAPQDRPFHVDASSSEAAHRALWGTQEGRARAVRGHGRKWPCFCDLRDQDDGDRVPSCPLIRTDGWRSRGQRPCTWAFTIHVHVHADAAQKKERPDGYPPGRPSSLLPCHPVTRG